MCFRAGLLRTWAMIARSPIICLDFGALEKKQEGFPTIPFQSMYGDLRTVGAQGGRIEDP